MGNFPVQMRRELQSSFQPSYVEVPTFSEFGSISTNLIYSLGTFFFLLKKESWLVNARAPMKYYGRRRKSNSRRASRRRDSNTRSTVFSQSSRRVVVVSISVGFSSPRSPLVFRSLLRAKIIVRSIASPASKTPLPPRSKFRKNFENRYYAQLLLKIFLNAVRVFRNFFGIFSYFAAVLFAVQSRTRNSCHRYS